MKYRDFVKSTLKADQNMLLHAVMGLCGESGEVIDILKKKMFHKPDTDVEDIIDELGDVRWYLELATIAMGISMKELETRNIVKLSNRYKNG